LSEDIDDMPEPLDMGGEFHFLAGHNYSDDEWTVELPHQCGPWTIGDGERPGMVALSVERFITEAQAALGKFRTMTTYRGSRPPHEAPSSAVPVYCPLGCAWGQIWDTVEEAHAEGLAHVRHDHGEADPEAAIAAAWLKAKAARVEEQSW
jgi:hypothetical protein